MKKVIYILIFVATNSFANCRVANDKIVCDNSNTLIETYNTIVRPVQQPQRVFIVNQPIAMPEITSNYKFDLLEERSFEVMQKLPYETSNRIHTR